MYSPDKKATMAWQFSAKEGFPKMQAGFDNEPKDQSRLLKTEMDGIIIVNTYIPQGYSPESEMFRYKLKWFERLRGYFEKNFKPTDPVIWSGDFNVAPEDIDVYDPEGLIGHVCFNPEVTKAFKRFVNGDSRIYFASTAKRPVNIHSGITGKGERSRAI